MTLSGSRGLIRVAHNPDCDLQAAMTLARVSETEVFRELAGDDFPGEYGERVSARRRGALFERNLFKDDAAVLRETLAPLLGTDATSLSVRNLQAEAPGSGRAAMVERLRRTRAVLADLATGRAVPDLVIQPQLRLPVGGSDESAMLIAPDAMVLDREQWMYLPVEIKSFIVRDGVLAAADRDTARRQAAVEVAALRAELESLGLAGNVDERAIFVFATPFGLKPHPAFAEQLPAELVDLSRALNVLRRVAAELHVLLPQRPIDVREFAAIVPGLRFAYVEGCVAGCALASLCRKRSAGRPQLLGDAVAELLGADISVSQAIALLGGARPVDERQARLAADLRDAALLLGGHRYIQGVGQ